MKKVKLIILDGTPGSGKSTIAKGLTCELTSNSIPVKFYHEMVENHPLWLYNLNVESLEHKETADYVINQFLQLYRKFTLDHINKNQVVIIESRLFQDLISFLRYYNMSCGNIRKLYNSIFNILNTMNPILIYINQLDMLSHWRFVRNVRGIEWKYSPKSEDELKETARIWASYQEIANALIDKWDIPKLILDNKEYRWDSHIKSIYNFIHSEEI